MDKIIFCNLDLLKRQIGQSDFPNFDLSEYDGSNLEKIRNKFLKCAKEFCEGEENKIYFYSRNSANLSSAKSFFDGEGYTKFFYISRDRVKEFIGANLSINNCFVVVGCKDKDFQMAVNGKALYIVPTWLPLEDGPSRYGIHVDTPKQLYKFIKTLNNQNSWYSMLEVDNYTTCVSLMDARYGRYAKDYKEKDMLENFQNILKYGTSRSYYDILLYHFLAGMTNTTLFNDIELFGMIPSSDCSVKMDLFGFMTQVRQLKGKRLPKNELLYAKPEWQNLLIRHTPKSKAHIGRDSYQRMQLGGTDEFATLCINPQFENKINTLRNKEKLNVCIFDDYMTHGNSFNSVRVLLEHIGANKIIFVSMGLFKNPFQKRDYEITGSVYQKGYRYREIKTEVLNNFIIEECAKDEVSELYDIFNS